MKLGGRRVKVLAIDIGSTRLKAALVDEDGHFLFSINRPSPLAGSKICADDVLHAADRAAREVCRSARSDATQLDSSFRSTYENLAGTDGCANQVI